MHLGGGDHLDGLGHTCAQICQIVVLSCLRGTSVKIPASKLRPRPQPCPDPAYRLKHCRFPNIPVCQAAFRLCILAPADMDQFNFFVCADWNTAAVGEACDSSQPGKIMRGDSRQMFHHLECRSTANQSKRGFVFHAAVLQSAKSNPKLIVVHEQSDTGRNVIELPCGVDPHVRQIIN